MTVYTQVGSEPAFGGRCEAWIELQLLGHLAGYADPLDAIRRVGDFVPMADPNAVPAGVAVVFGAAPSNEGLGHSGLSLGAGRMRSVWTDGSVEEEPIAQFAADNMAPLLGYHNFGRGVPAATTSAASSPATPAGGTFDPRTAVVLLALVFGASFGGDILDWLLD